MKKPKVGEIWIVDYAGSQRRAKVTIEATSFTHMYEIEFEETGKIADAEPYMFVSQVE